MRFFVMPSFDGQPARFSKLAGDRIEIEEHPEVAHAGIIQIPVLFEKFLGIRDVFVVCRPLRLPEKKVDHKADRATHKVSRECREQTLFRRVDQIPECRAGVREQLHDHVFDGLFTGFSNKLKSNFFAVFVSYDHWGPPGTPTGDIYSDASRTS